LPAGGLFESIFGTTAIGIAVEDLEGRPLFANPALCSLLGFTEAELRNKHCQEFSPPEDAERDWALFKKLRQGSIDNYLLEKRFIRKDGTTFWGAFEDFFDEKSRRSISAGGRYGGGHH
jgi:PAS domain S-box-containing protein